MSNRKLVSVQEITNIEPIEGADRIEVARILGWRVVVGKDITTEANVLKYEEPLPMGGMQIGRFDAPCSKSDAPRLQTLTEYWGEIKTLKAVPTVKVDGTSTTLSMDERGQVHVYSRNWELDSMSSNMRLAKRFQLDKMLWPGMAVQFELCGPGIQSNRLKLPAQRPFVFAVWKDRHKIDRDQWPTGMPNLAVPELDENEWALTGSVDDMIAKVDGLRGNVTKDRLDEGIVWHLHEDQQLSEGLANELGSNRCFKIINNKYLTKNGL